MEEIHEFPLHEQIKELFRKQFARDATVVVRAPGRVNLIGEHIDYNGYPVIPIALEHSVVLAAALTDTPYLSLVNADFEHYHDHTIPVTDIAVDTPPQWHDYVSCGVLTALRHLGIKTCIGMNIMVHSNLPPSAGLSSSSALVCAAAIVTMKLQGCQCRFVEGNGHSGDQNGIENCSAVYGANSEGNCCCDVACTSRKYSKSKAKGPCCGVTWQQLAQLCASGEKLVGTEGGGMDQAACLLSKHGCAKIIFFNPLRCEDITLPTGASFVVANSLQTINKAATSDFNCRVSECKLSLRLLSHKAGLDWRQEQVTTLCALQTALSKTCSEMVQFVEEVLHVDPYTLEEIATELSTTAEYLRDNVLSKNARHLEIFHLRKRARHVYSEAYRVYEFKKVCDEWNLSSKTVQCSTTALKRLGELMREAHRSASEDYECSHAALDRIVDISRHHALGARLTGAGWGGCVVALVPEQQVGVYCSMLREQFYSPLQVGTESLRYALFSTAPASGAQVYED